jgi:hypothetical protein
VKYDPSCDSLTREGAHALAKRIRLFSEAKGIEVYVEVVEQRTSNMKTFYSVRTNVLWGAQPNERGLP